MPFALFKKHAVAIFLTLSIIPHCIKAQYIPAVEWRKITNSPRGLNGQLQTPEQSGEEWWYSHKNVYDASGKHTSYVTVGYTSLVSTMETFVAAQELYNEGPDSPYNPITNSAYDYSALPEGCSDRDYYGEHRTPARGNIGLNTLAGDMIYCKPKTVGALEEVVQDPTNTDYFYVVGAHLGVKPYRNKTNFIRYNPSVNSPTNYFSLSNLGVSPAYTNSVSHIYVAKIHIDGTVIWEGLYGAVDYSTSPIVAYESMSYGYDIIKSSNGNLIVTGVALTSNTLNAPGHPCLIEIEPTTGNVLKKTVLPNSGNGILPTTNRQSGYCAAGAGKSIVEIGTSGKYAVATTYYFGNTSSNDYCNAVVWNVDSDFNLTNTWIKNPLQIAGVGPYFNSNIWEVKYHKASRQLLLPIVRDCINCAYAGQNIGQGYIYRLDSNGVFSTGGINPSPMGTVNAFDLRIGVEETSDGGFIAISSVRPPTADHSPATSQELGYLSTCPDVDFPNWDTDALVVKYTKTGATKWTKTFDVADNRPRQTPPGDLKRQECMYKVTEDQSGGYVISGNSSNNFDDNYMAKIADDCFMQLTYTTGPGNVIDIKTNTTWQSSKNVMGKIVVYPGVVFSVIGENTEIRFADSKLTGIETNITIREGGVLNVTDGAKILPLDPLMCKNSNWDGIVNGGNFVDENKLVVYPNPAGSNFNILYNGVDVENITYCVVDVFGNIVKKGNMEKDFSNSISTITLQDGMYFVMLNRDNKVFEKKKILVFKK